MAQDRKFHLTDDGPKECRASANNCPVGGAHYSTESEGWNAYEASKDSQLPRGMRKSRSGKFNPHSPEMDEALASAPLYEKKARVTMRVAAPGEKLSTVLRDGTVETTRVLEGGEAIVKNPMGEEYAMGMDKFTSRYAQDGDEWRATGEVKAVKNPTGENITIVAPWGEEQHGGPDCYIACNPQDTKDRYIIGGEEFARTYGVKESAPSEASSGKLQPIHGAPRPLKGGSYRGVEVSKEQVEPALRRLREHLGEEKYREYTQAKVERDGGEKYHITVVSPPETRALKKAGKSIPGAEAMEVQPLGIGHVKDGDNEAWYLVCSSPRVQEWRASMNLPPHDLHITLAFKGKDVHGVRKGQSTLLE